MTSLPLVGTAPLKDQLPPAVHPLALWLDQMIFESAPETMDEGESSIVAFGAVETGLTVTVVVEC